MLLALGAEMVMPVAMASDVAAIVAESPAEDSEIFSELVEEMRRHLDPHFARLKILSVLIAACAAVCLYLQFLQAGNKPSESSQHDVAPQPGNVHDA